MLMIAMLAAIAVGLFLGRMKQRSQALSETADLAQYNAVKAEADTQRALLHPRIGSDSRRAD